MQLSDIKAVIMDMDGVLWRGDEPLPGLIAFFEHLRAKNLPFVLATNNSGKSASDYVKKLERMGVMGVPLEQIITSGIATASYLQTLYPSGTPIHVLGGDGLRQVMTEAGFTLADAGAKAVVVGLDVNLTYEKLKRATLLINAGAHFIGSNEDVTLPTPEGLAPGAGSIVAALKAATGQQPISIGKPNAPMFEAALKLLGSNAPDTLMIGDRLNTDIAGANILGLKTALVLTGVATLQEVEASPLKPDGIYDDLNALMRAWG